MKKILAVLLAVLMLSSFATVANAQDVYSLGDVDMSGDIEVNSGDLTYLRKILLDNAEDLGMSDVNEDSFVDARDLVRLKKMLANNMGITISNGENTEIIDNWN